MESKDNIKNICINTELYIQNNPYYKSCIESGHFAERFDLLVNNLLRVEPDIPIGEVKSAEDILKRYWIWSIDNPETQKQCILQAMEEYLTQFTTQKPIPMGEMSKAGSILQCYIGFGNDLDGHYESVLKAMEEYASQFTTQRQEITDEEIENEADLQYGNTTIIPETAFIAGAKWMRDQSKGIDLREDGK